MTCEQQNRGGGGGAEPGAIPKGLEHSRVPTAQPFLNYPSVANLRWLREAGFEVEETHDPAAIPEEQARQIADAFGLLGSPERCAERLLQAREEAGVEQVFLFPLHDLARGYEMPEAEVKAFSDVIFPRLGR